MSARSYFGLVGYFLEGKICFRRTFHDSCFFKNALTSVLDTAIQGARGPGVFFVIPCVDIYEKIDLRVQNFDVPPQEVRLYLAPQPLAMIKEETLSARD